MEGHCVAALVPSFQYFENFMVEYNVLYFLRNKCVTYINMRFMVTFICCIAWMVTQEEEEVS